MDTINIYFNNSILVIDHINQKNGYKNKGFCEYTDSEITEGFISDFLGSNGKHYVVLSENIPFAFDKISRHFVLIDAAGGLVFNRKNELLVIFRRGKYDLPKGKCEKNETVEESAIREVMEECGIEQLKVTKQLPSTYHVYTLKGKYVLKTTYWFKMSAPMQKTTPQYEEDIERAEWLHKTELNQFKNNTYPTLLGLLQNIGI